MNRFFTIYSQITLLVTFIIIGLLGFWTFYPYTPIVIKNPLQTEKIEYKAGDTLSYKLDYCKYSNTMVSISRSFIDGVIYSMPDVSARNEKGCRVSEINISIPNLPTGNYQLKVIYSYEVNPIRTVSFTYYSNKFKITEDKN